MTLKNFLIFWGMKLFNPKLKTSLIFQERTRVNAKPEKRKFLIFFFLKSSSSFVAYWDE